MSHLTIAQEDIQLEVLVSEADTLTTRPNPMPHF